MSKNVAHRQTDGRKAIAYTALHSIAR